MLAFNATWMSKGLTKITPPPPDSGMRIKKIILLEFNNQVRQMRRRKIINTLVFSEYFCLNKCRLSEMEHINGIVETQISPHITGTLKRWFPQGDQINRGEGGSRLSVEVCVHFQGH